MPDHIQCVGRDAFAIKDGYRDACVRNKEKMKEEYDTQLPATPSLKPTVCAMSTSGTGDAMAGSEYVAGEVLFPQQEQLTRLLDTPFANLTPPQRVSGFSLQSSQNQSISPSGPSTHSA